MLSPKEFRDAYPENELNEELPDGPIGSLRDIQYLYGKLYTLATTGGGEYAPYLTPDEGDELEDTDESLIVIRVDVSNPEPRLADDQLGPVWVTRYTKNHIEKVAHCYFQNRGAGIDHSITHKSGKNKSPERLGEYAKHRFTRWPSEDAVQQLAEEHPKGWVINRLTKVAENEELLTQIKEEVQHQISGDQTALITVQVKISDDGQYQWPTNVDPLMEGMRSQRLSKLVTKNKADDSSGEAYDIVTGERARTVGTSQDPLNYYLGKQRETFPGLDIEEAWRSHPISEDAAVTVMNADTFVEVCNYQTFGTKVYYLPYFFGRPTPEKAYQLYKLLYQSATDEGTDTPIEDAHERQREEDIDEADIQFYVSAVMPHQTSRYDVFGETLNGRLQYPRELAFTHNRLVDVASAFNSVGDWTPPMPTNESWGLLASDNNRLNSVSTGWYFYQTFAERDDADADADDPRIEALVSVLSGDAIAVETLLEEYVQRIIDEQTDDSEHEGFPSFLVASQFAQLCSLANSKLKLLMTNDTAKKPITREPTYEEHTMPDFEDIPITDGGHPADAKLESFIENTPALSSTEGSEGTVTNQRRGAFLLGALVGDIGSYQEYNEDRSTTLVDQYPVKSITQSRIKKVAQETIAKTLTYTRQEKKQQNGYPGTKADHIVDRLRETILDPEPDNWQIDTDDLRFYYALGVTYGMNDHPWNNSVQDDKATAPEEGH